MAILIAGTVYVSLERQVDEISVFLTKVRLEMNPQNVPVMIFDS